MHSYSHERNVHASDVAHTRKSIHSIDSSMLKLFEFTNLLFFFFELFNARVINFENCQLSTGATNLSQLRTAFHPTTQTIMI